MSNQQTIGTCSLCGGPVQVPTVWWSVVPPTPTCASCGATKRGHGPVIDMEPARRSVPSTGTKLQFLGVVERTSGSSIEIVHEEEMADPLRRFL